MGLFGKLFDPVKRKRKLYDKKLEEGMLAQRKGDIRLYAQLSEEAEKMWGGTLPEISYETQEKTLKMRVDGGTATLTPANFLDGTTLAFDDVNDSAVLRFDGTNWGVISNNGATLA